MRGAIVKPTLGVAVIAKNEADRIGRLLGSVAFADRVVVVDSGSTDGTDRICRRAGAEVIHRKWEGYAAQKQAALEAVDCPWVLNLDADEALSPALARQIRAALAKDDPSVAGFSMPRLSRYLGRWIRHGGWYPDRKVRLVRPEKARWRQDPLHEALEVDGRIAPLSAPILHYVYRDISDQVATIDRFSAVYAGRRGPVGAGFLLAGVAHALGKWAECYLWKGGLLDGGPGLVIALNSAWYVFLKHAKAWEAAVNAGRDRSRAAPGSRRMDAGSATSPSEEAGG